MKLTAIVLAILLLGATPAWSQLSIPFDGFMNSPAGNAQLSSQGGVLTVSNLGSSGQDGVRQSVSCGNGGSNAATGGAIVLEPLNMSRFNGHGVKYGADFGTIGGTTSQQIRMCMIPAGAANEVQLQLDQFPGLATGEVKITVYLDGVEQVCIDGGLGNQIVAAGPPRWIAADTFFDIDTGSPKAAKIGGPYVNYDLDIAWLLAILINIPGQPPVQGDRIIIESTSLALEPTVLTDMSLTAGADLPGASLRIAEMWRKKSTKRVRGTGNAMVEVCDYLDSDCNGAPTPSDPHGGQFVRVSNLGSSGQDGVEVEIAPTDVGARFNLATPQITAPGPKLSLSSTGLVQGESSSRQIGTFETEMLSMSLTRMTWDYSPVQSQTARVEIYDGDDYVGGALSYVGPCDAETSKLPVSVGKQFVPDAESVCYVVCWPDLTTFTLPGVGTFQGTEVRVLAEGGQSATIERLALAAVDLPACDLNITGTPNVVSPSVLPAGTPVTSIEAVGDAEIEPQPNGRLKISNLGSSGCDGFSIDFDDDDDYIELEYRLDGLTNALDDPTGELHASARGLLVGDTSARDLGTVSLVSDGSVIRLTPDFSPISSSDVRVVGLSQGTVVVDTIVSANAAAASFVEWPDAGGKAPDPIVQGIFAFWEWIGLVELEVPARPPGTPKNAKNLHMVDEVRVMPAAATAPVQRLSTLELRLLDHEPFVFYDIILRAAPPTAVPSLPTAGAVAMLPNYPNPFNPQTTLSFDLARTGPAQLQVYGIDGRLVNTLVNETMAAGRHSITWNGTDALGKPVSSGTYFVQIRSGSDKQSRKVTLAK